MLIRTKRRFQLSLITVFATTLFLGAAGVHTALATNHDELEGKLVIKETCFNESGKPTVKKIKSAFQMEVNPTDTNQLSENGGITPFPSWETNVDFFINDFDGKNLPEDFNGPDGVALSKNLKKGAFHTVVRTLGGERVLLLRGVILVDENGESQKVSGKISGQDTLNDCIYKGSFKGKRCQNNECPDV